MTVARHAPAHALAAATILATTAALSACHSTSPLLFENRLDRNIKIDAVVPVFGHAGYFAMSLDRASQIGGYQRATLVEAGHIWDAALSIEGEQFARSRDLDHNLSISIRDASLINPRFSPLTVHTTATARNGYLALAEAIDGTLYLILADDRGTKLDQASTPLLPGN